MAERCSFHYGLHNAASTSRQAFASVKLYRLRCRPLPFVFRVAHDDLIDSLVAPTSDEQSAVNSLHWLWDRNAALTKQQVRSKDVRARKSLGQNYLINESTLQNIATHADIQPGDCVIEVGPGTGNLTKHLLLRGASVLAIEKDTDLVEKLKQEFSSVISTGQLRIVNQDVLRINMRKAIQAAQQMGNRSNKDTAGPQGTAGSARQSVKVVGNLPFYITKDFMRCILPLGDLISDVYLLLQEEVADRLIAGSPGDKNYRAANVELLYYAQPSLLFTIPRTDFFPPPKCNGAVVSIRLHDLADRPALYNEDDRAFVKFVAVAFSQRRKLLYNSLAPMYATDKVAAALGACGLQNTTRAQDLTLAQFVGLYNTLHT